MIRKNSELRNDFKEFSRILENVVNRIAQHGGYDMKFQRIYIDINNHLYKMRCTNNNFIENPVNVLKSFEEKIRLLLELISNPEEFSNFSIQFEFIHYQLKGLFPNGVYIQNLKLDDNLAEAWWYQHFQNALYFDSVEFWKEFSLKFPKLSDTDCVIKSMTFTQCNWFEDINKISFNLFLKLYGGWNKLEENWLHIYHHPGNLRMVTTENGKKFLENVKKQLGTLRTIYGSYVFCCDWRSTEGKWNMICAEKDDSIQIYSMHCAELIRELQNIEKYKYPKGKEMPESKIFLCDRTTLPGIPDSNQEHSVYEETNSGYYTIGSDTYVGMSPTNNKTNSDYDTIGSDTYVSMSPTNNKTNSDYDTIGSDTYVGMSPTNNIRPK